MLDKYCENQKLFYDYFMKSSDTSHVSHAYLIESRGLSSYYNLALDLAKFFLCDGVYDEKVCSLIDNNNYPNLKIVGKKDNIKKEDIVNLISDFSMKSVDDRKQVYILCDVQNLNKSAANSLLKFLEEPEENVIAILICDSVINVLPTIVSRCQTISLINDDNVYDSIFMSLYDENSGLTYDQFVKEYINKFFDVYVSFEEKGVSILANPSFYELKEYMYEFLSCGYYLYYDSLNYILGRDMKISSLALDTDIKKIVGNNSTHDIIRKMEIIDKFICDLKYNVNANLFLDNLVISLGSV